MICDDRVKICCQHCTLVNEYYAHSFITFTNVGDNVIVYIVRHAEAVEEGEMLPDEWRFLTETGRTAAKKMSTSLAKYGPKTRLTLTSPLTRAVQTAEIMAEKACRRNTVVASSLLLPGADIAELISRMKESSSAKRIMVVGHEPQLGAMVAALLCRNEAAVSLEKGSCVAIKLNSHSTDAADTPAAFLWYLAPGNKRLTSFKKAFPQLPSV
jgi:phosphohistidine phosphatase